jgi:hypothetical protein
MQRSKLPLEKPYITIMDEKQYRDSLSEKEKLNHDKETCTYRARTVNYIA